MRLHDYRASGNCYKVRLLLGLLDRPYERVDVDIFGGDTLTPEFGRLNPARETPVLELDDGAVLVQSDAILWYLGEGTAFVPEDRLERARVLQWLLFEQEWIMSGIGSARFRILTGRQPERIEPALSLARRGLAMLSDRLDAADFLVGDGPTIADVANFAYTSVAQDAGLERSPSVQAWLQRMRELPGFVDDYVPYPDNARPGRGRSIYDA